MVQLEYYAVPPLWSLEIYWKQKWIFQIPCLASEKDSTMNPSYCIRITGNLEKLFHATQILFHATQILFGTTHAARVSNGIFASVANRKLGKYKFFSCRKKANETSFWRKSQKFSTLKLFNGKINNFLDLYLAEQFKITWIS